MAYLLFASFTFRIYWIVEKVFWGSKWKNSPKSAQLLLYWRDKTKYESTGPFKPLILQIKRLYIRIKYNGKTDRMASITLISHEGFERNISRGWKPSVIFLQSSSVILKSYKPMRVCFDFIIQLALTWYKIYVNWIIINIFILHLNISI